MIGRATPLSRCVSLFRFLPVLALVCPLQTALNAQTPSQEVKHDAILLYDREFAADLSLAARPDQILVFTPQSGEGVGRFELTAGPHRFCLSGGAGYFDRLTLSGPDGEPVESSIDAEGCTQAIVRAGVVVVHLYHQGSKPRAPSATATVRVDPSQAPLTPTPLVNASNSPVGGFWAIQDNTLNGRGTFGNVIYTSTPGPDSRLFVRQGTAFDGFALFQLPPINGAQIQAVLGDPLSLFSNFFSAPYIDDSCGSYCAYGPPPSVQIKDLGNYQFLFSINPGFPTANNLSAQTLEGYNDPELLADFNSTGDTFQVLFRFFPDGSQLLPLLAAGTGEVALFQGCNHTGKAAVFIPLLGNGVVSPPYDLTALTSSATTLDGTAKSVGISRGTGIYWKPSFVDPPGAAVVNGSGCLAYLPAGQLFVEPLVNVLTQAHDYVPGKNCLDCLLAGQTLAFPIGSHNADFSGWNFEGADFTSSVLSGLNLHNASMLGATFIGAHLTDVDLSTGSFSDGLNFSGATLTRVNFTGRKLDGSSFKGATLSNIDLSVTSAGAEVDFTGATLNNVSR